MYEKSVGTIFRGVGILLHGEITHVDRNYCFQGREIGRQTFIGQPRLVLGLVLGLRVRG